MKYVSIIFVLLGSAHLSESNDNPNHSSIEDLLQVTVVEHLPPVENVSHAFFRLGYSEDWEQARWVSYFSSSGHSLGVVKRRDDFRVDTSVTTGSAKLSDYYKSGFDRGHLAPAHDFSWSGSALSETFLMSNMSPQTASFNRGIWLSLENKVRDITAMGNELVIVVGPIVEEADSTIGESKVKVPSRFFKAFIARSNTSPQAPWQGVGYVLKNSSEKQSLESAIVSIDSIEEITGLDLFGALDDSIESQVEQQTTRDWGAILKKDPVAKDSSEEETQKRSSSVQCSGKTQKGLRCKRKTKSQNGYCYQHQSQSH